MALVMLWWTGLHYGLRRKEYHKLKISEVDLENRVLFIRGSKGNKSRKIKTLKKDVVKWRWWFKERDIYPRTDEHDYVFISTRGEASKSTIGRYFREISEIIHEKPYSDQDRKTERITSHTLRYSFVVNCWRGGMDIFIISKICGHESTETTVQKYLRVPEQEILEKFEKQADTIF